MSKVPLTAPCSRTVPRVSRVGLGIAESLVTSTFQYGGLFKRQRLANFVTSYTRRTCCLCRRAREKERKETFQKEKSGYKERKKIPKPRNKVSKKYLTDVSVSKSSEKKIDQVEEYTQRENKPPEHRKSQEKPKKNNAKKKSLSEAKPKRKSTNDREENAVHNDSVSVNKRNELKPEYKHGKQFSGRDQAM